MGELGGSRVDAIARHEWKRPFGNSRDGCIREIFANLNKARSTGFRMLLRHCHGCTLSPAPLIGPRMLA